MSAVAEELDVEVTAWPVHLHEISEEEFLREFARVMHEWGSQLFTEGKVRLPTQREAREVLNASRYNCG